MTAAPTYPPPRPPGRGRLVLGVAGVLAIVTVAAIGITAWQRHRHSVYTDGDRIREAVARITPRDVLWQPPELLGPPLLADSDQYEPRLSWDGLTLYFVRGRPGGDADLYCATRTPGGWTPPEPLAALNSDADDLGPEPSADGKWLYFYSDRAGAIGGFDLWRSQRVNDSWQPPEHLGPQVNSPFNDYGPALSPDGRRLVFASNRPTAEESTESPQDAWPATLREERSLRTYDLFSSELTAAGAQPAERLLTLNTAANDGAPCFTPIGDFLYFASDRTGGAGGFDLYRARIFGETYGPVEPLSANVNTSANELDPALWQLGYALTFSSDREGSPSEGSRFAEEGGAPQPRYRLYWTTSREVFRVYENAGVDWRRVLQAILAQWPWLLAALLALLLLLLGARALRSRRLGLLARCLLASLMLHLLLMLLLSFWEVSTGVFSSLRRDGGTKITLASVGGDALTAQLREIVRSEDLPPPKFAPAVQTSHLELAPPTLPKPVELDPPPVEITTTSTADLPRLEAPDLPKPAAPRQPQPILLAASLPEIELPRQQRSLPPARMPDALPQLPPARQTTASAPLPAAVSEADASQAAVAALVAQPPTLAPPATAPALTPAPQSLSAVQPARRDAPPLAAPAPTATSVTHAIPAATLPEFTAPRSAATWSPSSPTADLPSVAAAPARVPAILPLPVASPVPPVASGRYDLAPGGPPAMRTAPRVDVAPTASSLPRWDAASPDRTTSPSSAAGGAVQIQATRLPNLPDQARRWDWSPRTPTLPAALPVALAPRAPEKRPETLRTRGGTEQTEAAVKRALAWLARHQDDSGAWGGQSFAARCECDGESSENWPVAMTGLALLTFLGAGHTSVDDGPYQETITRGLQWLTDAQDDEGDLRQGVETMYSHGIAAIALCEGYALTRDAKLRDAADRAVRFIAAARNRRGGGWRYEPGQSGDTSVLGWQVMALHSARNAGLTVEDAIFANARQYLASAESPRGSGRYGYRPGRSASVSMTAEALLVQELLGAGDDTAATAPAVAWLRREPPRWSRRTNTYYWYYGTLALFHRQDEAWRDWNIAMQAALVPAQRTDGDAAGSWDPIGEWGPVGGRVYQTSLCTLMLEVYYRYLPMYGGAAATTAKPPAAGPAATVGE